MIKPASCLSKVLAQISYASTPILQQIKMTFVNYQESDQNRCEQNKKLEIKTNENNQKLNFCKLF